jgi:hypothetical protein
LSETSWDQLRAQKLQGNPSPDLAYLANPVVTASPTTLQQSTRPKFLQKASNALPLLPPKIKPSQLSSEYRVLKSSLRQAEQRAGDILQELESSLAESDHMITLDPRWLLQFADTQDEAPGPDPFELAIQEANTMLDFLDRKQREQEACESMMQRLLEAFSGKEQAAECKDFGQIVRPQNIAGATGDWDGVQSELELQVRLCRINVLFWLGVVFL